MGIFRGAPKPRDLFDIYSNGFAGAPQDFAEHEDQCESGLLATMGFDDPIRGLHKEKPRQLLYQPLRKLDPKVGGKNQGALASESQTTGDCVSHGTRNCLDCTRAVEIVVKRESDLWVARGATEFIYSGRGHRGQGMSPQKATRIVADGQLLRLDYRDVGGPDLRKYNARTGSQHSSIPGKWQEIAADELRSKQWFHARTVEEALDFMAAGYAGHAGSQFASRKQTGPEGLNYKSGSWNHDMAHCGYDLTREIWSTEVVFVPNSWGAWNHPNPVWVEHEDILGPWIFGMQVVPIDDYERHIIKAGATYFHAEVEGDRIREREVTLDSYKGWGVAA